MARDKVRPLGVANLPPLHSDPQRAAPRLPRTFKAETRRTVRDLWARVEQKSEAGSMASEAVVR